jgi:hypothetical protein
MPPVYDDKNLLHRKLYQEFVKQAFNDESFQHWVQERKAEIMLDGRNEAHADHAVFLDAMVELQRCTEEVIATAESAQVNDSEEDIRTYVSSIIQSVLPN